MILTIGPSSGIAVYFCITCYCIPVYRTCGTNSTRYSVTRGHPFLDTPAKCGIRYYFNINGRSLWSEMYVPSGYEYEAHTALIFPVGVVLHDSKTKRLQPSILQPLAKFSVFYTLHHIIDPGVRNILVDIQDFFHCFVSHSVQPVRTTYVRTTLIENIRHI